MGGGAAAGGTQPARKYPRTPPLGGAPAADEI